ncbi:MAG: T9SS type A sorting domain-containing protein [Balneolaceae bacterium]|nr:T9SS type A sorting domain-containing protein [Balneolaceae bacterium]
MRTADQIRNNMYQELEGDETGLVGYWRSDEARDQSMLDLTSNNLDGYLQNGTSFSSETHPFGTRISGGEGWRIISSPSAGTSYGTLLDPLWTQGFTGSDSPDYGDANVFTWNETSGSWTSVSDAAATPAAGTGFIVFVFDDQDYDGTPDGFPKTIQVNETQNSGTVSPSLSYTDTGSQADDGWNLVGNPFGATIDWDAASGWTRSNLDASLYIWNASANNGNGAYQSWNGSSGTLPDGKVAPWQGFWVKANAPSPVLEISDEARSAGGVFRKAKPVPKISLQLSGAELTSRAVIMFDERAGAGKEPMDAWKLEPLTDRYLGLYTTDTGGNALEINALPLEIDTPLELKLGMKGTIQEKQYTLGWNPQQLPATWNKGSIRLTDRFTGQVLYLQSAGEYNFNAVATMQNRTKPGNREEYDELPPAGHGPVPGVLKTKESNQRFLLTIDPRGEHHRDQAELPEKPELSQNYPNPFNPATVIRYAVAERGPVSLKVYDVLGREVSTLVERTQAPGWYRVKFSGASLSSGMYIYRLKVGGNIITRKMTLVK